MPNLTRAAHGWPASFNTRISLTALNPDDPGRQTGAGISAVECVSFVLGQSAPDSGGLTGLDGPSQTGLNDLAAATDRLCLVDLDKRETGVPDREEQFGAFVLAGSAVAPSHHDRAPLDRGPGAAPRESVQLWGSRLKVFASLSTTPLLGRAHPANGRFRYTPETECTSEASCERSMTGHRSVCGEAGVEQSIDHLLQGWCSDAGDNCAKCLAQSGVFHGRHRDGLGLTRPGEPSSARRLLETSEAPPDGRERRDLLPVAPLDRAFVDGRGTGATITCYVLVLFARSYQGPSLGDRRSAVMARLRPTAWSVSPRWRTARRRVGACRSRPVSFPRCSAPRPEPGPCRPSRTRSPSQWRLPESAPAPVRRPAEAPQLRARRAR